MALPEENPLARFLKVPGDGPSSTFGLEDWNGLLVEVGGTLLVLKAKAAGFDAVAATAIEVLLLRINDVLGPAYDNVAARAVEIDRLLAQLNGTGISAGAVLESAARVFVTPTQRARIDTAAQAADLAALQAAADCVSATQIYLSGF